MEQSLRLPQGKTLEEAMKDAYRVYQANVRAADELVYRITKGAREGVPEGELLDMALQALARCRFSAESGAPDPEERG